MSAPHNDALCAQGRCTDPECDCYPNYPATCNDGRCDYCRSAEGTLKYWYSEQADVTYHLHERCASVWMRMWGLNWLRTEA